MTLKLRQVGNSLTLTIPRTIALSKQLFPGESIELVEREDGLFIPLKPAESGEACLESLFAGYNGDYEPKEVDWGAPVGEEIW